MAARRHWRFVVRDQYGFVIQNAQVFVYQPGTTTAFTGTAYDAASGGSPVTNPFTTNAYGEVEAWFDTAQVVDVLVTDNTNAAYRATGGPLALVDFTSFTEKDDIYVSASDQYPDTSLLPTSVGEVGDIAAGIVNPFTAVTGVAGATTEWADAGHVHPYTALTPGTPEKPRTAAGSGDDLEPARDDHIHGFASAPGKTAKQTKSTAAEENLHTHTVPANTLAAGSMFRISLKGYQTNGTTGVTWTFRVRWGGVAGTLVFSTAFATSTTAHTDYPHSQEWLLTVQSIGATCTITCSTSGVESMTTTTPQTEKFIRDVQAAAVTIDTTVNKDLVLTLELSTVTGAPQFEVDNVLIEQVA
jgi:hypothetical protein